MVTAGRAEQEPGDPPLHHALDDVAFGRRQLFEDFLAVRDRLDPDRLFTNRYLDRVLG